MDKKRTEVDVIYGKIPPQAIELEEAILGSLMIERDAITKVDLFPELFYKEDHQKIFNAIERVNQSGKQIDLMTVITEIKNSNELESVGGLEILLNLTRRVASAAHIEQHVRILIQTFIRRELIRVSNEILNLAYDESNDLDDIMQLYESSVAKIDRIILGRNAGKELVSVLKELSIEIERRSKLSQIGGLTGISSGFGMLNKYTSGWQPGWMVVFASRPAMGKTAIAINRFAKEAARSGKWVNIFSLEMDSMSLAERLVIGSSGIDTYDFKSGRLSQDDWRRYHRSVAELESLPIYIDDSPYVKISHIRNVARSNKRKNKCDMIIIDYLQLADSGNTNKNKNREQEVSEMSRRLKLLAKELQVPIIVLSQLSRAVELRADRRPVLSDLRESGSIEQDADMVIFPFRPEYYRNKSENPMAFGEVEHNEGVLIIAKNRHGAVGDIRFYHNDTMTDFSDEPFSSERFHPDQLISPNTEFDAF